MASKNSSSSFSPTSKALGPRFFNFTKMTQTFNDANLFSKVNRFVFNKHSTLLAVVVDNGKRVVLIDLRKEQVKVICYRGFTSANIQSVDFSPNNSYLCVFSDRCSIHIFYIKEFIYGRGPPIANHSCTIGKPIKGKVPVIRSYMRVKTNQIIT